MAESFYQTQEWRLMREYVFAYWGRECLKCGSRDRIHVDHVIPRSMAMHLSMSFNNLQPLCEACNLEKSNNNCDDFRSEHRKNPSDEMLQICMNIARKRQSMGIVEASRTKARHVNSVINVAVYQIINGVYGYAKENARA